MVFGTLPSFIFHHSFISLRVAVCIILSFSFCVTINSAQFKSSSYGHSVSSSPPGSYFMAMSSLARPTLPPIEMEALEALYQSTNGPSWNLIPMGYNRWNFGASHSNPCFDNWVGIVCSCNINVTEYHPYLEFAYYADFSTYSVYYDDADMHNPRSTANCSVVKLYLDQHRLRGSLPTQLGNLVNLTHLHLGDNFIRGTIPNSLANLTKLRIFEMFDNGLTGTIPSFLGSLTQLEYISLGSNFFRGSIPDVFGDLRDLISINFHNNSLVGRLPSSLGQLTQLEYIGLRGNSLTGSIPYIFGSQMSLKSLNLKNNLLVGPFPSSVTNLKSLEILVLGGGNIITGNIPPNIGFAFENLTQLDLQGCGLSGDFPTSVYLLSSLQLLDLSMNKFYPSSIPDSLYLMSNLRELSLEYAELTGSLPSTISQLTYLDSIHLNNNAMTGTIPPGINNLYSLNFMYVNSNGFTGPFPSISNLQELKALYIYDNQFTGSIPVSLCELPNLQYIAMGYNSFSGKIPPNLLNSSLGFASPLTLFETAQNLLTGSLPGKGYFNLPNLNVIDISGNRLTGTLPPELFAISGLQTLIASSNCFSGTFPSNICSATNLVTLNLNGLYSSSSCGASPFLDLGNGRYSSNSYPYIDSFTGVLSTCIFQLPKLVQLQIIGNGIVGDLQSLTGSSLGVKLRSLSLAFNQLSGTIPDALILRNNWEYFDLSYNKFTGVLSSAIDFPSNGTLNLTDNRLSGPIPESLFYLENINILAGNDFACSLSDPQSQLPRYDISYNTYICGSNGFETALLVLAFCVALFSSTALIYLAVIFYRHYHNEVSSMQQPIYRAWYFIRQYYHFLVDLVKDSLSSLEGDAISLGDPDRASTFFQQSVMSPADDVVKLSDVYGDPLGTSAKSSERRNQHKSLRSMLRMQNMIIFRAVMVSLLRIIVIVFSVVVCALIVLYSALTNYCGTQVYKYAWVVSAINLIGLIPTVATCIVIIVALLFIQRCLVAAVQPYLHYQRHTATISVRSARAIVEEEGNVDALKAYDMVMSASLRLTLLSRIKDYLRLLVIGMFNVVVVLTVNVAYVFVISDTPYGVAEIISLALGIFKLSWGRFIVPFLVALATVEKEENKLNADERISDVIGTIRRLSSDDLALIKDKRNLILQLIVTITNNIAIPCLAVMVAKSECFKYVFIEPPMAYFSYTVPLCTEFADTFGGAACRASVQSPRLTAYSPPFIYEYRCGSTLLKQYSSVFVFMFAIIGFVSPFVHGLSVLILKRCKPKSRLYNVCVAVMPLSLRPLDTLGDETFSEKGLTCFLNCLQQWKTCRCFRSSLSDSDNASRDSTAVAVSTVASNSTTGLSNPSNASAASVNPALVDNPLVTNSSFMTVPKVSEVIRLSTPLSDGISTSMRSDDSSVKDLSNEETAFAVKLRMIEPRPIFEKVVFVVQAMQILVAVITFGLIFPPIAALGVIALISHICMHLIFIGRIYNNVHRLKLTLYMKRLESDCANVADLIHNCLPFLFTLGCWFFSLFAYDMSDRTNDGTAEVSPSYAGAVVMLLAPVVKYLVAWLVGVAVEKAPVLASRRGGFGAQTGSGMTASDPQIEMRSSTFGLTGCAIGADHSQHSVDRC